MTGTSAGNPLSGAENIIRLLPRRPLDMHKGDRGRLLVAGGSGHYPGAPSLSALGALRSGAGVVTLLSLPQVCAACAARLPEAVFWPAENVGDWLDLALDGAPSNAAAVVGPGLERSEEAQDFVTGMWKRWPHPLLVDGDGLFALAEKGKDLPPREDTLLTPHEGEAARLLGTTPGAVCSGREEAVRALADRWGGTVLLKGHGTLIARRGDKIIHRLDWGGPELAVPGSGDVLSGCIGALLAAGLNPLDAARLGGALHGMAGERLAGDGVDGVLASEIAGALRAVLHGLRRLAV
ncbi:MAG: NAD(P)H-hydrate dehydratase [Fretibacterium sp.]|nr:NAD(P)H-hydrate dehydratase [Fretibacterium sp.]